MKDVVAPFTMNKAVRLVIGGIVVTTWGLSSVAEAMPTVGYKAEEPLTMGLQPGRDDGGEIIRLVGTRDHNEDPTPEASNQPMSNPKKKMDKSMKQGSDAKSRSGQGADGHPSAKHNKSIKPDQHEQEENRPDDRRQGKNIDPTP